MTKIEFNKRNLIICSILFFICVIGAGIYFISQNSHTHKKVDNQVEQGTVRYDSKFKSNETGNIIFPAYTEDLILKKNKTELPVLLVNPLANKNIYLQYKISVNESSKKQICIGETKLIKSGQAAKGIEVNKTQLKELTDRVYNCRIDVFAFKYGGKGKEKTKLNQAYWNVKLRLE